MTAASNQTQRPLSVPLPGGKNLHARGYTSVSGIRRRGDRVKPVGRVREMRRDVAAERSRSA